MSSNRRKTGETVSLQFKTWLALPFSSYVASKKGWLSGRALCLALGEVGNGSWGVSACVSQHSGGQGRRILTSRLALGYTVSLRPSWDSVEKIKQAMKM